MIAPPALKFILEDANRVAPGRNRASDGIFPDARHLAQGVASDHNPDGHGVCHAVDVTNDPAHGMDTWAWAQQIARRMVSGQETRVKYLVSNDGTKDVIFNPSVSMTWRQNGSVKQEHRSHLHTSILDTTAAEMDTEPYFVGAGASVTIGDDDLTPEQAQQLANIHAFIGELKSPTSKPGDPPQVGALAKLRDLHTFLVESKAKITAKLNA